MMMPPVATGPVDRDDDSVGMSANGHLPLSDRGSRQTNSTAAVKNNKDFKKAYMQVRIKPASIRNDFSHLALVFARS